jgi:hypothetical protein
MISILHEDGNIVARPQHLPRLLLVMPADEDAATAWICATTSVRSA